MTTNKPSSRPVRDSRPCHRENSTGELATVKAVHPLIQGMIFDAELLTSL